ncbi:Uncharacterised protein [uncultured archaeon]|nr:Uncharacterised protein [uncultured archaeon]
MIFDIYQIAGWLGVVLLIVAYFLLSVKKLKFNSIIYNLLNFLGAIGIIVSTIATQSWPSVMLNFVWAIIAVFSIFKIINTKPVYKELR